MESELEPMFIGKLLYFKRLASANKFTIRNVCKQNAKLLFLGPENGIFVSFSDLM